MRSNVRTAARITRSLDCLQSIQRIDYLREGYSRDRKYVLWSADHPRYLLRISEISELPARTRDFEYAGQLHSCGVACPKPLHMGTSEHDCICYTIHDYIQGTCAKDQIPQLTRQAQLSLGLAVGRELRKIHEALEAPVPVDWYEAREAKYRVYQRRAVEHGLAYDGQPEVERFIEDNLRLMKGRPTAFLHGDYHPGNMILSGSDLAGIIDFNRCRWGDPYFEFYKVAQFGAPLSVAFACGQVDGYFSEGVPDDFWPLYNLYVAMVLTVDLVWTNFYYPSEMGRSNRLIARIKSTHDFMSAGPPAWYTCR